MLKIGCHLSSAGGYAAMARTALSIGANTFQFFTRNPRGGAAKAVDPDDVSEFISICGANGIGPVIAHAPYTLNACAADARVREFSSATICDDLARMECIPGNLYNFHPGSHVGQGADEGIRLIAEMLDRAVPSAPHTTVLLETMAGKGSEVGRSFEELRRIIDTAECGESLGVCLDTCHVWDGGYDIAEDMDGVLKEFDSVLGLDRLKAVHLNGSLNTLGAHKDRHAKLGEGFLSLDALIRVVTDPRLSALPFVLETPNDLDGYAAEIKLISEEYSRICGGASGKTDE